MRHTCGKDGDPGAVAPFDGHCDACDLLRIATTHSDFSKFDGLSTEVAPPLTFETLQRVNAQRCNESFRHIDEWSPTDWGCAVAGEVGEMCNLLKKMLRGESIPKVDVADEIADAVLYLDLLSSRLGINLGDAVRRKFNIVSDRKGSNIKL